MSLKTGPVENTKFPWYKERLQTKYLRDLSKTQQLSGALDGRRWRFLSPGLDDFRDGYPTVYKELFTRCDCGMAPAVFGMPKHQCAVKLPQKTLSKDQACYSKQNPQSQTQREFIDAVELRLKQHPLALYPHLESSMTPELFDQVLAVLDPVKCVKQDLSTTSPKNEIHLEDRRSQCELSPSVPLSETVAPLISMKSQKEKCRDNRPKNIYKWQRPKETRLIEDMTDVKHLQDDVKLRITRLFFEWINSLGGDTGDLTESTILNLFKSDYEKKPLLTLIKNKTPAILDSSAMDLRPDAFKLNKAYESNRPQTSQTCTKRAATDLLRSPSDITDSLDIEGPLSEEDEELKERYAIQAFRQFIINKRLEMPRFLSVLFSEEELEEEMRCSNTAGSTLTSKSRACQ
ncbi:hypothetical protein E1301_Tti001833 [Triplophysa tibetana]|uniref:Protein FAM47E n=1 Tax=Triplophysa tibetana TaxID=1572043 RepID=A0A5A9P325_9TELE|nr:hypothetical protein E1301_Tti001833 [Triplophysa tibetana]